MPAPGITFTVSGNKVSSVAGYNYVSVEFLSDILYTQCEIRATKAGDSYGRGIGKLIASFSTTPANVSRIVDVYDTDLLSGEGEYRISIFAQSEDGGWNDNCNFIPYGSTRFITSDGDNFLCMR